MVFESISLVITPPNVSIPKDRGVTSRSTTSLTSPPRTPPCIAAPRATTSSGLTDLFGSLAKIFLTISFLQGTDADYSSGILCSFDFVGLRTGSSNIQIPVDDLYLFDPNGNDIPYDDIYLGSTVITVK